MSEPAPPAAKVSTRRILRVSRSSAAGAVVAGACPCGADLRAGGHEAWAGVPAPVVCAACGAESSVELRGEFAEVSRPYAADEWHAVQSTNLLAAGRVGEHLLVRFHGGATYLYRGAGGMLLPLLGAESKGKFFAASVKPLPATRLCEVYGCRKGVPSGRGAAKRCADHPPPEDLGQPGVEG